MVVGVGIHPRKAMIVDQLKLGVEVGITVVELDGEYLNTYQSGNVEELALSVVPETQREDPRQLQEHRAQMDAHAWYLHPTFPLLDTLEIKDTHLDSRDWTVRLTVGIKAPMQDADIESEETP
jgi:hypothetical protein